MYNFWLECFRIENTGSCKKLPMKKKHLTSFMILFIFIFILIIIYFIWKYFQKKNRTNRSPTALLPYPNRISA
jgi:TRAP-type C4-dicarboxylate transport system permease small subunit